MNFLWGNTRVYEILARFSTLRPNFLYKNRIRFCTIHLTRQIFRKHKIRNSIFYHSFNFLPGYYPIYSFYSFILLLFIATLSIFSVWAALKWIFCTWNLKPLPALISGLLFKTELTILIKRESISGQGWVLGQCLRGPLILKTLFILQAFLHLVFWCIFIFCKNLVSVKVNSIPDFCEQKRELVVLSTWSIAKPDNYLAGVASSCISRVSPVYTNGVWSLRNLPPQIVAWLQLYFLIKLPLLK